MDYLKNVARLGHHNDPLDMWWDAIFNRPTQRAILCKEIVVTHLPSGVVVYPKSTLFEMYYARGHHRFFVLGLPGVYTLKADTYEFWQIESD